MQTHQLSGTSAFDDRYALTPLDSYAAILAFNDDRWNNALYVRILNLLGNVRCPVEPVAGDETEGFRWHAIAATAPLKRRILKWGYHQVRELIGFLARENDTFIINSYLPKKEEIKLQLALGQVPQLWASPQFKTTIKPDRVFRQNLSEQIAGRTSDTLFEVMRSLVFEILPVCYLEGFAELTEKVQQLPWPKKPEFIFTSNNFDTDEMFKLWVATKVESGFTYVTGQHGNNYGSSRYMYPSVEEATADRFLTWGWTDGLPQHTPAFLFKIIRRIGWNYDPNGGLLMIELHEPHRITTWDGTFEFGNYSTDQRKFIEKLQKIPREQLTIRMHGGSCYARWSEIDRWRDFDPDLKIETGAKPIAKLIAKSRLVIHSYDSTGILETLSQNIPTLVFWQNGLDHLRDSAKPYYQLLVDAGIVHFTPESAAAKVNEVWGNVEGWWSKNVVQEARKQFCDRYARVSLNPVHDLKKLLQEQRL